MRRSSGKTENTGAEDTSASGDGVPTAATPARRKVHKGGKAELPLGVRAKDGPGAVPGEGAPMSLTVGHAFRRIAAERGLVEAELFTRVVDTGLITQAEQGQGWAVKLLLEALCAARTEAEEEQPLSPEAGRRIYEILLQERAGDG